MTGAVDKKESLYRLWGDRDCGQGCGVTGAVDKVVGDRQGLWTRLWGDRGCGQEGISEQVVG